MEEEVITYEEKGEEEKEDPSIEVEEEEVRGRSRIW